MKINPKVMANQGNIDLESGRNKMGNQVHNVPLALYKSDQESLMEYGDWMVVQKSRRLKKGKTCDIPGMNNGGCGNDREGSSKSGSRFATLTT